MNKKNFSIAFFSVVFSLPLCSLFPMDSIAAEELAGLIQPSEPEKKISISGIKKKLEQLLSIENKNDSNVTWLFNEDCFSGEDGKNGFVVRVLEPNKVFSECKSFMRFVDYVEELKKDVYAKRKDKVMLFDSTSDEIFFVIDKTSLKKVFSKMINISKTRYGNCLVEDICRTFDSKKEEIDAYLKAEKRRERKRICVVVLGSAGFIFWCDKPSCYCLCIIVDRILRRLGESDG